MATRQKDKDIVNFYKKLKKRYPKDATVLSRDHKVLEHLVFAIFLENATFEQACSSFNKMERYFIDWNEVRVSKANEIASVIGNVPNALKVGERLRRLLQWIFDKTFKFDLEDTRAKGVEETIGFLKSVPFSTRFMNEYAQLLCFGSLVFPMDEGVLRVFRLLGWVKVQDEQEVVPILNGAFKEAELLDFFFAAHELGCELMDESTQKNAIKFLATVDPNAAKRSFEPLVESTFPTDPSEIAKLYAKHERRPKNVSPSAMMSEMFGDGSMDSDDIDESDDFEKNEENEGFDPYREDGAEEFGASDAFGGRKNAQDATYNVGKRAETNLSKDGASYFESGSEPFGLDDYDSTRAGRPGRGAKTRKRSNDDEQISAPPRKSGKASSQQSAKSDDNLDSVAEEDLVVARAPVEKKTKEKKSVGRKSVEQAADSNVEKARARSVDGEDAGKTEVKKAPRATKATKTADDSRSVAKATAEGKEKKSALSVQDASEKKAVDETVKKEKKSSDKETKEAEPKPRTPRSSALTASIARVKNRENKTREQEDVDVAAVKSKRKRESESKKGEPPATRSKKG